MIVEPELRVADFAKAGADIISVHAEASSTIHLHRTLNQARARVRVCSRILAVWGARGRCASLTRARSRRHPLKPSRRSRTWAARLAWCSTRARR